MDELSNLFGGAEQLWQYIKIYATKAGREATRVVLELYYVVKSPHTPALDKTLIIAALGYQLLPDDKKLLSREKYGLLGLLDMVRLWLWRTIELKLVLHLRLKHRLMLS